jgi:glutamate-ammonia-ligase adenylyltransferase
MGKFGGQELNYSSDIDVIFFYGEDGQLNPHFSHQEFFTRLCERIIATFSATEADGTLFRIDLRLRPEGALGPLARSLDSIEHYYARLRRNVGAHGLEQGAHRRVAMRARKSSVTNSPSGFQAFIYPRTISLEVLEEIRALKARIEREIVGHAELRRNVKLGYGGIREIEFVTQTLQLLHGAKHAFLQERSTLKALRNLQELDLIPSEDMETLIDAYRWLRTVEHRLANRARSPDASLARAAGSALRGSRQVWALKMPRRSKPASTNGARRCARSSTRSSAQRRLKSPRWSWTSDGFAIRPTARRALDDLGGGGTTARFSPRTKQLFARLETPLLEWLRRVADPDTALTSFVRFVERYGSRGLLYETLPRESARARSAGPPFRCQPRHDGHRAAAVRSCSRRSPGRGARRFARHARLSRGPRAQR